MKKQDRRNRVLLSILAFVVGLLAGGITYDILQSRFGSLFISLAGGAMALLAAWGITAFVIGHIWQAKQQRAYREEYLKRVPGKSV